eukprot:1142707-Pelagomonas_calceolata.AAC.4
MQDVGATTSSALNCGTTISSALSLGGKPYTSSTSKKFLNIVTGPYNIQKGCLERDAPGLLWGGEPSLTARGAQEEGGGRAPRELSTQSLQEAGACAS